MRYLLSLGLAAGIACACACACGNDQPAPSAPDTTQSGPLAHGVYVWQRAWTSPVIAAVTTRTATLDPLIVLVAEVSFDDGHPTTTRAKVDLATLAGLGRAVTLAIRVGSGPPSGPAGYLARHASDAVTRARAAGVSVGGLQIDYDAATAGLADYARWLQVIRARLAPLDVPLSITALPTWMTSPALARVLDQVDHWVLQVHSLARPTTPEATLTLCDPPTARAAVNRAATYQRPFWVALPTYGYRVAFARDGRYLGLSAEQPNRGWPQDADVQTVRASAPDMQALVRAWTKARPSQMLGVLWYRLPIATDTLNWRDVTLASIVADRTVAPNLQASLQVHPDGLLDVTLHNAGNADAPLRPVAVSLTGDIVAMDALAGFRARRGAGTVVFDPHEADVLPPSDRRAVGWVRPLGKTTTPPSVQLR